MNKFHGFLCTAMYRMYRYLYVSSFRQWWAIILIFPPKTLWKEKETSLDFPKVCYYHHIKYYYHNREHLLLRLEKCSAIRSFVIAIPIYPGITTFSCRKLLRSNTWRAKAHWKFEMFIKYILDAYSDAKHYSILSYL